MTMIIIMRIEILSVNNAAHVVGNDHMLDILMKVSNDECHC